MTAQPLRKFAVGVANYWYAYIPALLLTPADLYNALKPAAFPSFAVEGWMIWLLLLLGTLFAAYKTYRDQWNELPKNLKENPAYLDFCEASELALHYVGENTLRMWSIIENAPPFQIIAAYLEEAVEAGDLKLFERLRGGRIRPISYVEAARKLGSGEGLINISSLVVRRKDIKPAWRAYAKRKGIERPPSSPLSRLAGRLGGLPLLIRPKRPSPQQATPEASKSA